jgi:hypothetical protein
MEYLGACLFGGLEERVHGGPIGRAECDVGLAEALSTCLLAEPEVGHWRDAISDDIAKVHESLPTEGCERCVVEGHAGVEIGALNGKVIEHATDSCAVLSCIVVSVSSVCGSCRT